MVSFKLYRIISSSLSGHSELYQIVEIFYRDFEVLSYTNQFLFLNTFVRSEDKLCFLREYLIKRNLDSLVGH